jgi:hypothetical protein
MNTIPLIALSRITTRPGCKHSRRQSMRRLFVATDERLLARHLHAQRLRRRSVAARDLRYGFESDDE